MLCLCCSYLMAQEAVRPATVVTTVALVLAPLYNGLLVFRAGLGVHGAAYAMVAMQARLGRLAVPSPGILCASKGIPSSAAQDRV